MAFYIIVRGFVHNLICALFDVYNDENIVLDFECCVLCCTDGTRCILSPYWTPHAWLQHLHYSAVHCRVLNDSGGRIRVV